MIGYLDPVGDRAAIEAYRRAGYRPMPLIVAARCVRMMVDPADRPGIEPALIELVMRQLRGAGWDAALGRPVPGGPGDPEGEP